MIGGTSSYPQAGKAAVFLCSEESSKGAFNIPSFGLSAMPVALAAGANALPSRGYVFVAGHPLDNTFAAPGLDLGFFNEVSLEAKQVAYQ